MQKPLKQIKCLRIISENKKNHWKQLIVLVLVWKEKFTKINKTFCKIILKNKNYWNNENISELIQRT